MRWNEGKFLGKETHTGKVEQATKEIGNGRGEGSIFANPNSVDAAESGSKGATTGDGVELWVVSREEGE